MPNDTPDNDNPLPYHRPIFRPQEPRLHPLAIIAIVAGILSWCTCISNPMAIGHELAKAFHWPDPSISALSAIALFFPSISVVTGCIARWRIRHNRKKYIGSGPALIGLAIGLICAILWLALLSLPAPWHLN